MKPSLLYISSAIFNSVLASVYSNKTWHAQPNIEPYAIYQGLQSFAETAFQTKVSFPEKPWENSTVINSKSVEESMEDFVGKLKTFFWGPHFNHLEFQKRVRPLFYEVLELENRVQKIVFRHQEIFLKLCWAKSMFRNMIYSSDMLDFFQLEGPTRYLLVHKMSQLNVRLLGLYDYRGIPDIHIVGYNDILVHIQALLSHWKATFENLPEVSLNAKLIFQTQVFHAETILKELTASL